MDKYLQDEIFGKDSELLIKKYKDSLHESTKRMLRDIDSFARDYVERGVRLGYVAAKNSPSYFVEIGCGLGIPSLTLAKLGYNGEAFDFQTKIVNEGNFLSEKLKLSLPYKLIDFYAWDPKLPEGTFLIADKPRGGDNSQRFGFDINSCEVTT